MASERNRLSAGCRRLAGWYQLADIALMAAEQVPPSSYCGPAQLPAPGAYRHGVGFGS